MEYSKQKLLFSILIRFEDAFNEQINESAVNQEMGRYLRETVQELSEKQYRGSLFDNEIDQLVNKVNQEREAKRLVFNDYTSRLWKQILQIKQRTTSFETAYSLLDIFNEKKQL